MRYLTNSELSRFHDAFLAGCARQTQSTDLDDWGFPGGIITCDTYTFSTTRGQLLIGHSDTVVANRWWIPVSVEIQKPTSFSG